MVYYLKYRTVERLNLGFSPTTFELLACSFRSASTIFTQVVMCRPGSDQVTDKLFDEITTLLESVAIFQSEVIISGDFNIHVDDLNDRHGRRLLDILDILDILDSFDMVQNISVLTHKGGHTLDLVITRQNSPPMGYRVDPPVYSDHGLTLCAFPPVNFAERRSILEAPGQRIVQTISVELSAVWHGMDSTDGSKAKSAGKKGGKFLE